MTANVIKNLVLSVCIILCLYEFSHITIKTIQGDSFQSINELHFEELYAPVLTLCPAQAWKKPAPFINATEFQNATFSWEEIFHPETLKNLRNKSRFHIIETYSSYYGLCFTMQKLYKEKVSDYSFTMAVNGSLDYNYYLHNPYENEYLLMSVYPYEVSVKYMDASNDNHLGGADIFITKEIIRKIPAKSGCKEISIEDFAKCLRQALQKSLRRQISKLKCKVPALDFTQSQLNLTYCNSIADALQMEKIIYKSAIEIHQKKTCGKVCDLPKFQSDLSYLSKNVLGKELQKYGNGYFIIWSFYSTLSVEEKIETYIFDFDTALIAFGGTLGLYLGWSIHSIFVNFIDMTVKHQSKISSWWCK